MKICMGVYIILHKVCVYVCVCIPPTPPPPPPSTSRLEVEMRLLREELQSVPKTEHLQRYCTCVHSSNFHISSVLCACVCVCMCVCSLMWCVHSLL